MISGKDKIFHRLDCYGFQPSILLSQSSPILPTYLVKFILIISSCDEFYLISSHNKKLVGKVAEAQYLRGWSDEAVAGLVLVVRSAEWRLPLCPWLHQPAPRPVALHSSPTPRGKEQQWWRSCAFRESITVADSHAVEWSPWDVGIVLFQIKVQC